MGFKFSTTNWFPSVLDTIGLVIRPAKIVPEMTYYVLSGTLSLYTTTTASEILLTFEKQNSHGQDVIECSIALVSIVVAIKLTEEVCMYIRQLQCYTCSFFALHSHNTTMQLTHMRAVT